MLSPFSSGPSPRGVHRLADWRCRQEYAWRHILNFVPRQEPPGRALGSLVHIGQMYHWRGVLGLEHLDPVEAMRSAPPRVAYRFNDARELWRDWLEWERGERRREEILFVEQVWEARVRGETLTARVDLGVRAGRMLVLRDHKTSGARTLGNVTKDWEMHSQMILLWALGKYVIAPKYKLDFGGVEIHHIGTSSGRGGERFGIRPVPMHVAMVKPCLLSLAETAKEIDSVVNSGRDPWNYRRDHSACRDRRYGMCEYTALCRRGRDAECEFDVAIDEVTELEE